MASSWIGKIIISLIKNRKTSSPKQKQEEAHKNLKGSMTVEAAMVLPMFLFAILSLAFIIEIVRLQIHIGCAAGQVSKEMAGYAYTYNKIKQGLLTTDEESGKFDEDTFNIADTVPGMLIAESRLVKLIGESFLDSSIIVNGSRGLSLIGSEILDDGRWIKLLISYKVRLPFSPLPNSEIKLVQYSCSHAWVGYCHESEYDERQKTVYMTEHGNRYHLSRSCKYLNIKSRYVNRAEIGLQRNNSGGKYYPCHRCMGKAEGYYITDYGSSYHTSAGCTAIKRNIIEKKLEDLEGTVACCKECERQK